MKLNDPLTNMLGEFFAFQKTPEFKPCSASMQELNKAVKEEKDNYNLKVRSRPRFSSVGNVNQEVSNNPNGEVTMRRVKRHTKDRPSSLVERIKQRLSPSRGTEAINEEEEANTTQEPRKLSVQSEKLQIIIS
ncbi:hypothetical protein KIN20_006770 [Parelaphostrongylus tenuis]|uniref:Uncharacterized protein n=1 Tax=Parelaphostrongylus tenuis TaxID=148309 RepID=A0AAD5MUI2_PARTN|nr:hypothetical protein KIN20_006770 [Parelaphostrongylus tenuis]